MTRHIMQRTVGRVVGCALAITLGAAFLGGAGGPAPAAGAATSREGPGAASSALAATTAAGSAEVDSTLRLELAGPAGSAPFPVLVQRFTGRFETSGRRAVMSRTSDIGSGPTVVERFRFVHPRYWMAGAPGEEFEPGRPWALFDLLAVERRLGRDGADAVLRGVRAPSPADATPVLEMLRAVPADAPVRDLGPGRRGDVPVRRYGVRVDLGALYGALGARLGTGAQSWLTPTLLGRLGGPQVPATIEVDAEGRLRRLSLTAGYVLSDAELAELRQDAAEWARRAGRAGAVPSGVRARVVFTARLDRFGEPVHVEPPPDAEVVDALDHVLARSGSR